MNTTPSPLAQRLAASATFAMVQKAAELRAAGIDVISMSVGEPDFATPDYIKEAAHKAIDENYSKYSPVTGYMWLREAVCKKLKNENNLDYTPAEIIISNGAKQALSTVVMAIAGPGDEVIVPTPCWVSYTEMVKLAGATPVSVHAGIEQDFKITAAQLEAAITPKSRAIMLCSPSNPTGQSIQRTNSQHLLPYSRSMRTS